MIWVRTASRRLAMLLASSVALIALWWGLLVVFGITPFIGKSPLDVFQYAFVTDAATENRTLVLDAVAQTLRDAAIGYVVGLAGATLIAVVFVLAPLTEKVFMPVAMIVRTFPLIALVPLIILVFGRGPTGLAAMGFIVVFFAALVTITFGLRSTPTAQLEIVAAHGGGSLARTLKVSLPHAVPAFFTAARIAAPHAITGALVAEWLITGEGTGAQLLRAAGASRYAELWTAAVAIIIVTTLIYTVIALIEDAVLARFAD